MLDDRVRAVLARLEAEEPRATTGRFLFALCAPQTDCEVLEVGAGDGYVTLWLAAGVRYFGGRVLSLGGDSEWRRNVAAAGLAGTADLVEGEPLETLPAIDDVFDVVVLSDADEELLRLARAKLEPAALVVAPAADSYSRARQVDPAVETVTLGGLELSVVLRDGL